MDADLKYTAKYHEMAEEQQKMYDLMLVAQKKLRAEEGAKMMKEEGADKLKEKFASMTPDQQKAFKAKWAAKMKDDGDEKDGFYKNDMAARAKAGYFKKMGTSERGMFDKKMAMMKKDRDGDAAAFKAKLAAMMKKAGVDQMTAEKKKAWLADKMEDRKKEVMRKEGYRKEDEGAREKAGYWMKMSQGQRDLYDKKEAILRKKRGDMDKEWDKKRDDGRMKEGWDKMTDDKKKMWMMKFGKERGDYDKKRMMQRADDDDYMSKSRYWQVGEKGRGDLDKAMAMRKGMMDRMSMSKAGLGSSC